MTDVARAKQILRAEARARRAACDPAADLSPHILALDLPPAIAAVWPLPGELDLRPLLHTLHARGHAVLLPQTPPRGQPLIFRRWHPGSRMLPERFGTSYPDGEPATPDLILVPLLAFDRAGGRLGYGGGYYDRTLAAHPATPRAGIGHAALEIPLVPMDTHDARLGMVVTERGIIVTSAQETPKPGRQALLF
jgi:5-formyltetrahydrofolate cyclo-ligase